MKREQLFVILLALVTFFAFNDALPTDIMESRNIVTAREIADTPGGGLAKWLVPTMNGELRLEKPPLPTWVAAVIETVCPRSLAAQRAAAGVMGLMWTWFLCLFAKLLTGRRDFALLTAMVFLTSYHIVVMGRTATWDIYCHAFMMGGIYMLARGLWPQQGQQSVVESRRQAWRWLPGAGLMMGLSWMSKGPVSFYALLLPALVAIIIFVRPRMRGKWPAVAAMAAICVVVSAWWYVYLIVCHPAAVDFVVHKETGAWSGHNVRPWYYYWRFFTEMGVWAVLMLASIVMPIAFWRAGDWRRESAISFMEEDGKMQTNGRLQSPVSSLQPPFRSWLFSLTWALAALVLLSLMPEKKIRYLLPMMAPCALCVACVIDHIDSHRDVVSRVVLRVNGYLVALIALVLPVAVIVLHWVSVPVAVVLSVAFVAVAAWVAVATWHGRAIPMVYGVCVMFMLIELFLLRPVGQMFGNPDMRSISETQKVAALRGVPFYHPKDDDIRIELVYEAGRKILPIDVKDTAALRRAMPFVLVSHASAGETLPAALWQKADTVSYGVFDDNKHPKTDRHYTRDFVYYVTMIRGRRR